MMDYQRDFDKLQNNFAIIKNSYLDSMAEHLWSYDTRLLDIQLDGLSRLEGVSYLKLTADQKVIYSSGKSDPTEDNFKRFEILHKNTNEILGTLDVELDIKSLQDKYLREAFGIFVRQAAKTLVVVFCLYFVFNHILVSHIQHIASFLQGRRLRSSEELRLERKSNPERKDELDILVQSINQFRTEIFEAYMKLEQLNQALEQKVGERTRELTSKNETLERAMSQIKRMQMTLVAQEKLASLGRLTSSVAHEIRNPLNFVLNFSELLGEAETSEEMNEVSRVILKHSQRIDQIVRSMQILSGDDSDTLETVDLNETIQKAYHQTLNTRSLGSSFVPPKVNFRLGDNIRIQAYANSLQRAIANILDNSIHALEKKSSLSKGFEPELTISTAIRGDFVEIVIRDNGIGISPMLEEKIFEPFLTTKTPGEGAGLGLTVSFNIAQRHGGTLKYSSEQGQWTEFTLLLPLTQERMPA
ncbi:Sensor protein ZraS [compost metagenome]